VKITAHLGVLDEIELVDAAIDHLAAIGVDHVVAFDMGSRDGTLEALERRVDPAFELIRLREDTPWAELHALTVESVRGTGADWVLFLDADEFWLPAGGSLRPLLAAADADVLTVPRYNVVLGPEGPTLPLRPTQAGYADTWLHVREVANFRVHLADNPETPWITGVPMPKVVGRLEFVDSVGMGGHNIGSADGRVPQRARATDIVIAHVPFSTRPRFERRVANIRNFLERSPDYFRGAEGWHWRRLDALAREGRLEEEFLRQVSDPAALAAGRADGSVRSVAELLTGTNRDAGA
jgi:glycosyltransferase involved in cell wall biosynthesis